MLVAAGDRAAAVRGGWGWRAGEAMAPTVVIRGERYELIRGKHYEVDIEYDEEYVIVAIAPIWDSARRHTLDIVLHRGKLREELDERLRDLFCVLNEARKAIERKLADRGSREAEHGGRADHR